MKTIIPVLFYRLLSASLQKTLIIFVFSFLFFIQVSKSQCIAGYTSASLNWDYKDYLHKSNPYYNGTNPVTGLPFVSTAMIQTQNFAIGTSSVTLATTIPVAGSGGTWGDITTHTGETGAYGTGADIGYIKVGTAVSTITLTFLTEVRNLQFSVFDIDQEITFAPTATNTASVAQSITLTKPAGLASLIPLNGNAALTTVSGLAPLANWATAGGSGTAYAVTSNLGTINVDIAGPVKTVVLNFSNDGNTNDFWLSDITACVVDPGFPNNYHQPYTQPFTNPSYSDQPGYFLSNSVSLSIYMVNPLTGLAELVFTDPNTVGNTGLAMNSLAYDPVNKWLYYVMDDNATYPNNKSLKKYDFNTETIVEVLNDMTTLGFPTFIQGVEYGGAAFYNGSLYLGIEECPGSSYGSNAESVIWKIDFNGSGVPISAVQAFAINGDNGSVVQHDWGDFVIKDGTIITQGTNTNVNQNQYVHYNMQTGAGTTYAGNAETAGQLGMLWNGNVYRIKTGTALYNNNGTIGAITPLTVSSCSPAYSINTKDASDPFKPKCDFGDAPGTYDPVALSPAVHQQNCNNSTLRIGAAWDREWSKNTSADASGDATDEEGIGTVTIMVSDGNPYNHVQDVTVLNNTGSTATLAGWLDYNANGVFDASEGVVVSVPSNAAPQTITLGWTGITIALGTPNSFLRVRLVGNGNTMTASNPTGWYNDGEVEDYPVVSSATPLDIKLLDFNAFITRSKNVQLNWKAVTDEDSKGFELEKSSDQQVWESIAWINKNEIALNVDYNYSDLQPFEGRSYYRLKMVEKNGTSKYSNVKWVYLDQVKKNILISPNPVNVNNNATISFTGINTSTSKLIIRNLSGQVISSRIISIKQGDNRYSVNTSALSPGIYIIEISTPEKTFTNKMIVK